MKSLLLVMPDPIAMGYYLELFRDPAVHIEPAPTLEEGLQAAGPLNPDVILLDLVSPEFQHCESALSFAELLPNYTGTTIALPIAPHELCARVLAHRNIHLAAWQGSLVTSLLSAMQVRAVGFMRPEDIAKARRMREATLDAFQNVRNISRQYLHRSEDLALTYQLFYTLHILTHRAYLADLYPAAGLCSALENLLFSLFRRPELGNRGILQTITQGIDALGTLLDRAYDPVLRAPSRCRVLMVDDDTFCCDAVSSALTRSGLVVEVAHGVSPAIAKLERNQFDLLLLDVSLPYSNGFEICERVRASVKHHNTPILFLTGLPTFQNRVQSNLSGGNEFLAKPFHAAELPAKALTWIYRGQLGLIPDLAAKAQSAKLKSGSLPVASQSTNLKRPQ